MAATISEFDDSQLAQLLKVEPADLGQLAVQVTSIDYKRADNPQTVVIKDIQELVREAKQNAVDNRWFIVEAQPQASGLVLQDVLLVLQIACDLELYSVRDALSHSVKTKVDHDYDSLYVSVLTFNLTSSGSLDDLVQSSDDVEDFLVGQPSGADVTSTMSDLALRIHPSWERLSLFLTPKCCVTVSFQPNSHAIVPTKNKFADPAQYLLERQKGPDFLFYKLLEDLADETPQLIKAYRKELFRLEDKTFNTLRPSLRDDTYQTKQLHLMRREVKTVAAFLSPAVRVLETVLELSTDAVGEMSVALIEAETLDALEEVRDDFEGQCHELEMLSTGCTQLMNLMFNLCNYRGTVSMRVRSAGFAYFIPLSWWCGIYGSNWINFPELSWGTDASDPNYDPLFNIGWPGGYLYFVLIQVALFLSMVAFLRYLHFF